MTEKRYLGVARLINEGGGAPFDPDGPPWTPLTEEELAARGRGKMMRDGDPAVGGRWYVVRDSMCSYDIRDEEARVWTLSLSPTETGWNTDSGYSGYGLTYAEACELADAANDVS
jgi:hypothetical protein